MLDNLNYILGQESESSAGKHLLYLVPINSLLSIFLLLLNNCKNQSFPSNVEDTFFLKVNSLLLSQEH